MTAPSHDSRIRGRIALLVLSIWLGVPALGVLAAIFGYLQLDDLKINLFPMWHQYLTWLATLVVGYYFGASRDPVTEPAKDTK